MSQSEAALHFLTPAILDYTANGKVQSRIGNADLNFSPHGVYPTVGNNKYIAICCENDDQWQALCDVIGDLDFNHGELVSAAGRLSHQEELDRRIVEFCAAENGTELEAQLQAAGIPASVVQNSPELVSDPQLDHLKHFITLPHHEGGNTVIESSRIRLSRSSASIDTNAPTFNRDMMYVLNEILGYDDEKLGELLIAGVLE